VANIAREQKQGQDQWWYVADLIAGIAATPTQKYLLALIHRHTHSRKGYAWASQRKLAWEMSVEVSTVERGFRWAKQAGLVTVRTIRTGKTDQHNEYQLNIERLKELQRPDEDPAPVQGATSNHPASTPGPSGGKDPAPVQAGTPHLPSKDPANGAEGPRAHAGRGLEVKQVESTSRERNAGGEGSLRSPAPGNVSPELQPQINAMVDQLKYMLYSSDQKESPQEKKRTLEVAYEYFKKSGNAIGMDFGTMTNLYNRTVQEYFAPAAPPQPEEKPAPREKTKPKPRTPKGKQTIARSHQFWLAATGGRGTEFLRKVGVSAPRHLTDEQFEAAMRFFQQSSQRVN
jgi:hypothetical protein